MDASVLDYSYANLGIIPFNKTGMVAMHNAVRVRESVKEKLKRVFSKVDVSRTVNPEIEVEQVNPVLAKEETVPIKRNSIYEDTDKVIELGNKVNYLVKQGKAETHARNVVLYTKPLVEKTIRKFNTLFSIVPSEKQETIAQVAEPSNVTEIPDTWDKLPEDMLTSLNAVTNNEVSYEEPSASVVPEFNPIGNLNQETTNNLEAEAVNNSAPVVPDFFTNKDEYKEPTVTQVENPSLDFVKEPAEIGEQTTVQKVEPEIQVSIPVAKVEEEQKSDLSLTNVIAKAQRAANELKEIKAENASLKAKIEDANGRYASYREEVERYKIVVRDLTEKLSAATQANGKLTQENDTIKGTYVGTISSLESTVEELKRSKSADMEASKKTIAELKQEHALEIEKLKEEYNKKMKEMNDLNEQKLSAVYSTISEVFGDAKDDTFKKVA